MNELLEYIRCISIELETIAEDISCDALFEHSSQLSDIADKLNTKYIYYSGFAAKEDKKKVRFFQAEMTDDELPEFMQTAAHCWGLKTITRHDITLTKEDILKD